jgi:hypothetical protein
MQSARAVYRVGDLASGGANGGMSEKSARPQGLEKIVRAV